MKSSKERNRSKKSGYAVVESIMPSLIARAPAVRVEKHQNELGERFIDADFEKVPGLPCFWKEERDEIREEEAVKLASRNQMTGASARKDFCRTLKPGVQMGDHVPVTGSHDLRVMYDFKEYAAGSESREIQPSSSHTALSSDLIKGKKQVKFKPAPESKTAHDNDIIASNHSHEVPENVEDEDDFMEAYNRPHSSGFFNSNSCSWKKHYDPSEYKESSNLFEKHVDSSEKVDSTIFQWGKKYDPLKFKDLEEPDSVRSIPPLAIGSDAEGFPTFKKQQKPEED